MFSQLQRVVHSSIIRSALRFAVTIVAADLIVHAIYGSATAAMLGSVAVIVHLYFLDFDGTFKERLTGQGIATLIGAGAVVLGTLCAGNIWVAVIAAFVISSTFAYARVLRGYVARSAVGLQAAFFLPLMVPVTLSEMPSLLGAWIIGSALAVLAALVVLPHRRTGAVRAALSQWLRAASALSLAIARGDDLTAETAEIRRCRDELLTQVTGSYTRPGAVSKRQRALASMVAGARWSMPVVEVISPQDKADPSVLAHESARAYSLAAELVEGNNITESLPDLPTDRERDLDSLVGLKPEVIQAHYPARLLSIGAMNLLYRSAQSEGLSAPTPDVGQLTDEKPLLVLKANLGWKSLWLHNALRTGLGAAVCVLLVRLIGLEHGLWVILAALSVTQVTFSAVTGTKAMFKIVGGAVGGVLLASAILLFHLPYVVFLVALPISAFLAKRMQAESLFLAQLAYTPFALINLSVLVWPPGKGLEILRVEDILLGAAVAAGFTLLVFPMGINRLVTKLQHAATTAAQSYVTAAVSLTQDANPVSGASREKCVKAILEYENALDAAFMSAQATNEVLLIHEFASAQARDYLVGGDTCTQLYDKAQAKPALAPVARELTLWWKVFLARHEVTK
jgi:uncharacterized membrane protein YccC